MEESKRSLRYRLKKWFVDNVNWCEGYYYGTSIPKPDNKVYNWFYQHWLWPWAQNDCLCCNTVRGCMYGFALGFTIGYFL